MPDLVVLDAGLPGLDGFATCRRLKSDPALTHTPVIFLSAMEPSTGARRAREVGGAEFIEKRPPWATIARRSLRHLDAQGRHGSRSPPRVNPSSDVGDVG